MDTNPKQDTFTDDQGREVSPAIWVWDGTYAEGVAVASEGWFCMEFTTEQEGVDYLTTKLGFTTEQVAAARQAAA